MFCYNCGNQLKDGDRFCDKCGLPVNTTVDPKPAEEPVAEAVDPVEAPAAEPVAEPEASAYSATGYAPPQYTRPPVKEESKLMGILSLICGIGSFIFGWIPFLMFVPEVLAAVFGIVGLVKKQGKGMAAAGLILGLLAFITTALTSVLLVLLLLGEFMPELFPFYY